MRDGWIYVMTHPLWSRINGTGAVKIGRTTLDPTKRGLQIASTSGLLRPPTVEYCAWVADRVAVETAVHRQLGPHRVRKRREMFAVSVATAQQVIEGASETRYVSLDPSGRPRRSRLWRQFGGVLFLLLAAALAVLQHYH